MNTSTLPLEEGNVSWKQLQNNGNSNLKPYNRVEILLFDRNTWNHIIANRLLILDKNTWSMQIIYITNSYLFE